MYIPDLFGAYIKGRELAIEKNWQDLKNYEQVEAMRNANDLQALKLLGERADFGINRSIARDNADASKRANEVGDFAQRGMVARALLGSDYAEDQYNVYNHYRPQARQIMYDQLDTNLGKMRNDIAAQAAQNTYLAPKAAEFGVWAGENKYSNAQAANIEAGNAPMAARQAIAASNQNHTLNTQTNANAITAAQYAADLAPVNQQIAQLTQQQLLNDTQAYPQVKAATEAEAAKAQIASLLAERASVAEAVSAAPTPAAQQAYLDRIRNLEASINALGAQYGVAPLTDNALVPTPADQAAQNVREIYGINSAIRNAVFPVAAYPVTLGRDMYNPQAQYVQPLMTSPTVRQEAMPTTADAAGRVGGAGGTW